MQRSWGRREHNTFKKLKKLVSVMEHRGKVKHKESDMRSGWRGGQERPCGTRGQGKFLCLSSEGRPPEDVGQGRDRSILAFLKHHSSHSMKDKLVEARDALEKRVRKLLQKTKMEMMVAWSRWWGWKWGEMDATKVFGGRSDRCGH